MLRPMPQRQLALFCFLALLATMLAIPAPSWSDEDELQNLVLKYEPIDPPAPLHTGRPLLIQVRPFQDLREDSKIAGRSATYTVFHVKGTGEQYETPAGFLDLITQSFGADLQRLGFQTADPATGETGSPADELRAHAAGTTAAPVPTGLVLTGDIRRFYGEVVTNTWAWPFVGKTAQGEVKFTVRLLDAATGEVLVEQQAEGNSEVGGGPDRVNNELNRAFALAVKAAWSPEVLKVLGDRAKVALEKQTETEAALRARLERLAKLAPHELLPAPRYEGLKVADLKRSQEDPEWSASLQEELQGFFRESAATDDTCVRLARSCSYSFQRSQARDGRVLLVTTVPSDVSLEDFLARMREETLPWLALQQPRLGSYGVTVTQLKGGARMVALAAAPAPAAAPDADAEPVAPVGTEAP